MGKTYFIGRRIYCRNTFQNTSVMPPLRPLSWVEVWIDKILLWLIFWPCNCDEQHRIAHFGQQQHFHIHIFLKNHFRWLIIYFWFKVIVKTRKGHANPKWSLVPFTTQIIMSITNTSYVLFQRYSQTLFPHPFSSFQSK